MRDTIKGLREQIKLLQDDVFSMHNQLHRMTAKEQLRRAQREAINTRLASKFELMWLGLKGPELVKEYQFCPGRKWKFDYASPKAGIAIELEGGVHSGGRHTRGDGYDADCEKYNEAAFDRWTVFRLTPKWITVPVLERIAMRIDSALQSPSIASSLRSGWYQFLPKGSPGERPE